jgi:hypothetical protein
VDLETEIVYLAPSAVMVRMLCVQASGNSSTGLIVGSVNTM